MTMELERPAVGTQRLTTTPTSLELTRPAVSLDLEEWVEVGRTLARSSNAWLWWVGDWFVLGEKTYGSTYSEAMAITGLAYPTLKQLAWVSGAVEMSRRRDNLSFAHHVEVASLSPFEQERWLARAVHNGLTREQLRAEIRATRELPSSRPLMQLRLEAPRERAERWNEAAERAGRPFGEWAADALDAAAA